MKGESCNVQEETFPGQLKRHFYNKKHSNVKNFQIFIHIHSSNTKYKKMYPKIQDIDQFFLIKHIQKIYQDLLQQDSQDIKMANNLPKLYLFPIKCVRLRSSLLQDSEDSLVLASFKEAYRNNKRTQNFKYLLLKNTRCKIMILFFDLMWV